jgi:hypothetical protein
MSKAEAKIKETKAIGERLAREVGVMAGRLGLFLDSSLPNAADAIAAGRDFLYEYYAAISDGLPLSAWNEDVTTRKPVGQPHPLDRLTDALTLSREEIDLLLLAGMAEQHEGFAAVLRTLHPRGEPRPTAGLAAQFLGNTLAERLKLRDLLECGAATLSGALRVTGDAPFFERSLLLPEALWSALHGLDAWPASVVRVVGPVVMHGLSEWLSSLEATRAVEVVAQRLACTVLVTADNEDVAFHRARAIVWEAGLDSVGVSLRGTVGPELEQLIRVHTLLRGVVPVIRLASTEGQPAPEATLFSDYPGVLVLCGRAGMTTVCGSRPLLSVTIERMSPAARRQMWKEVLPDLAEQANFLAARHPVEPAAAAEVAADVRLAEKLHGRATTADDISTGFRARGGLTLSAGVKLLRPRATFDDLIISRDRQSQLREAIERLDLQSRVFDEWGFLKGRMGARGVRLLFAGPPGTGKTLSAEVIAGALSADLLVVDISRVVSKWIGETEKNLSAVFDAAERAQAVLFFDEADALFGKRTEVSDAHDRYANLETAYLLARLESFEGLAVLATNLRQNIDPAFLRRLEFVIDFDEPDREERFALWRCHLPAGAPLGDDVNLYELASLYPVVGGVIRNAATAAGFLAASDGTPIVQNHFVHAIRREYEKAGRAFPGVPAGMTVY